jgi:tRNA U34 5-methylaminomethyl-2-thiouridine-forming methyltransferase MnmC
MRCIWQNAMDGIGLSKSSVAVTFLKYTWQMAEYTPIISSDGSKTLYSEQFGEHYHSLKDGAYRESLQKHVHPAYEIVVSKNPKQVVILDVCFGLGYNTLTTLAYLRQKGYEGKIIIESPEKDEALLRVLPTFLYPEPCHSWKRVIDSIATTGFFQENCIEVQVYLGDAREHIQKSTRCYDVIYLDPFSPKKNPLLWTKEYFFDLVLHLNAGGLITTYSQASAVRFGMYTANLIVYNHSIKGMRDGTLASFVHLDGYQAIDMLLKQKRNPALKPLCDADFSH